MAMHRVTGFRETHDLFGYLILALPDAFPPHQTERSMEVWFDNLQGGLDSVANETKKPEALELLAKVKQTSRESYELFLKGETKTGRLRLQDADDLFDEVGRLLKGRSRNGG